MKLYLWLWKSVKAGTMFCSETSRYAADRRRRFQSDYGTGVGPLKVVTLTAPRKRKAKK